jgi:hypothetical protein
MKVLMALSLLMTVSFSPILKAELSDEHIGIAYGESYQGQEVACEGAKEGVDHEIRNKDAILISKEDTCYECSDEVDSIGTLSTCYEHYTWVEELGD